MVNTAVHTIHLAFKIINICDEGVVSGVARERDLYPGPLLEQGECLTVSNIIGKVQNHASGLGKGHSKDDIHASVRSGSNP